MHSHMYVLRVENEELNAFKDKDEKVTYFPSWQVLYTMFQFVMPYLSVFNTYPLSTTSCYTDEIAA